MNILRQRNFQVKQNLYLYLHNFMTLTMRVVFLCGVILTTSLLITYNWILQPVDWNGLKKSLALLISDTNKSTIKTDPRDRLEEENDSSISLNPKGIVEKQQRKIPCPKGPIVSVVDNGRLANKIWEYAAVWSVARLLGRPGYVPKTVLIAMNKIYTNLSLHSLEEIKHCGIQLGKQINKWKLLPLDKAAENFKGKNILLQETLLLPDPVMLYKDKLHDEFRIQPDLLKKVEETVNRVGGKGLTRVGVHVRRTDFLKYLDPWFKMKPSDASYYKGAMEWFRRNVKGPLIFLIVSDDLKWCKTHLLGKKDVKIASKSAEHDLALLTTSNYTIIDYGTYSFWGAIMAGGNTWSLTSDKHFSEVMTKNFENWRTYHGGNFSKTGT